MSDSGNAENKKKKKKRRRVQRDDGEDSSVTDSSAAASSCTASSAADSSVAKFNDLAVSNYDENAGQYKSSWAAAASSSRSKPTMVMNMDNFTTTDTQRHHTSDDTEEQVAVGPEQSHPVTIGKPVTVQDFRRELQLFDSADKIVELKGLCWVIVVRCFSLGDETDVDLMRQNFRNAAACVKKNSIYQGCNVRVKTGSAKAHLLFVFKGRDPKRERSWQMRIVDTIEEELSTDIELSGKYLRSAKERKYDREVLAWYLCPSWLTDGAKEIE
eukprot:gene1034-36_t